MEPITYRLWVEPGESKGSVKFRLEPPAGKGIPGYAPYPDAVEQCYRDWQIHYLRFYRAGLRAKEISTGVLTDPPEVLKQKLDEAEIRMIDAFEQWLSAHSLQKIEDELTQAIQKVQIARSRDNNATTRVEILLTCQSVELERFPWEVWRLLSGSMVRDCIRFSRSPEEVLCESAPLREGFRRGKARMLVILGDDTGIDNLQDLAALNTLEKVVEIEIVNCVEEADPKVIRRQISKALVDMRGWDLLFFSGHSNETTMTGGEISIAKGHSITIRDIEGNLREARQNGLQFALFNSCSGLRIAASLVSLGFNQVGVMREPIKDEVALEFLQVFVKSLGQYRDIHDAMRDACYFLETKRRGLYPSAYLVPILFRHPQARLFQIQPIGLKQFTRSLRPGQNELWILGIMACLSVAVTTSGFDYRLQDFRQFLQTLYRQTMLQQLPPSEDSAPILLVELGQPPPVDRHDLAQTIDDLSQQGATLFGIDFLLPDDDPKGDAALMKAIRRSSARHSDLTSCFAFGVEVSDRGEQVGEFASQRLSGAGGDKLTATDITFLKERWRLPSLDFVRLDSFAPGSIDVRLKNFKGTLFYMNPPTSANGNVAPLPAALASLYRRSDAVLGPTGGRDRQSCRVSEMQWPPTSVRQWDPFNLRWFYPMVDYTIPPNAIYQVVPASRVRSDLQQLGGSDRYRNRAVLIGSGHESAGVDAPGSDRLEIPLAVDFWRKARSSQNPRGTEFTGAELLAYQFQAYLNRRFVWPIPDLWMVGLAAFAGKTISLRTSRSKKSTITLLGMGAIAGVFYILACLQIYFATLVLVPILFPLVTMGAYFVMSLLERRRVRG